MSKPHICQSCRKALSQPISSPRAVLSPLGPRESRKHAIVRYFQENIHFQPLHTSTRYLALEETQKVSSDDPIVGQIPIRKTASRSLPKPSSEISNSQIRRQLKAWSQQAQKRREESISEHSTASGQFNVIPNAVFLEEPELDDEAAGLPDETADDPYESSNELVSKSILQPGDTFKVKLSNTKSQFAIFLGYKGINSQFFLSDGRCSVSELWKLPNTLYAPDFVSQEEIDQLLEYLPKEALKRTGTTTEEGEVSVFVDVPPTVSAPLMRRLVDFEKEIASFTQDHIRALDRAYEILAHETEFRTISLPDVVQRLFHLELADISAAGKMALFGALAKDEHKTQPLALRSRYDSFLTLVAPKVLVRNLDAVTGWARAYQEYAVQAALGRDVSASLHKNPLNAFVEKARRLILKSRKIRSPTTTGCLGPSAHSKIAITRETYERVKGEEFSESDRAVLDFLWNTYRRLPMIKSGHQHVAIGSLILRATGAYPALELERRIGSLLLEELGTKPPWEEALNNHLLLPLPNRIGSDIVDRLVEETESLVNQLGFADLQVNGDGLYENEPSTVPLPDSMAHLRRDWGDTAVYCLDYPGTNILDDGISLERASHEPSAFWIHVHVAHMSAYFDPHHVFGRRARHMPSNINTGLGHHPMMPATLQRRLCIGGGRGVLTFSALVTENGELKDIKVEPGIVHNVIKLNPAVVDDLLGYSTPEICKLVVGGQLRPVNRPSESESYDKARRFLPDLEVLNRLCLARARRRGSEVAESLDWVWNDASVSTTATLWEPMRKTRMYESFHYLSDPQVTVATVMKPNTATGVEFLSQRGLVEQLMVLGCEAAGKWAGERHIPALYTGTTPHPQFPVSKLNSMEIKDPNTFPKKEYFPSPVPHVVLNLNQYLRVTSPLRRYEDLVAHWQIDAYLKAEAANGPISRTADIVQFPLTREMLETSINRERDILRAIEMTKKAMDIHWTYQALFRAFHFKEAPLPKLWNFTPHTRQTWRLGKIEGRVLLFNLQAHMLPSEAGWEKELRPGLYLPVKLELVDPPGFRVHVRAVGPVTPSPSYDEDFLLPAQNASS